MVLVLFDCVIAWALTYNEVKHRKQRYRANYHGGWFPYKTKLGNQLPFKMYRTYLHSGVAEYHGNDTGLEKVCRSEHWMLSHYSRVFVDYYKTIVIFFVIDNLLLPSLRVLSPSIDFLSFYISVSLMTIQYYIVFDYWVKSHYAHGEGIISHTNTLVFASAPRRVLQCQGKKDHRLDLPQIEICVLIVYIKGRNKINALRT